MGGSGVSGNGIACGRSHQKGGVGVLGIRMAVSHARVRCKWQQWRRYGPYNVEANVGGAEELLKVDVHYLTKEKVRPCRPSARAQAHDR